MNPQLTQQFNLARAHIDLLSTCFDDLVAALRRADHADPAMIEMADHHVQHGLDCMRRVFPT